MRLVVTHCDESENITGITSNTRIGQVRSIEITILDAGLTFGYTKYKNYKDPEPHHTVSGTVSYTQKVPVAPLGER